MGRNDWNAVITEGLGTFLFFLIGMGAALTAQAGSAGLIQVALAHGLVLAVLVSSLGAVSGAHFNPAVTFGVWISGNIPSRRALAYVLAQLIGAVLAGLALTAVYPISTGLGTPALASNIDPIVGIGIEALLTLILVLAVFGTAIDPRAPKVGGLAIGLAITVDILMGGNLTGAAMNPARWFGPAAVTGNFTNSPVWILGPLLGAAVGALLYRFVLAPEADPTRTPGTPVGGDGVG